VSGVDGEREPAAEKETGLSAIGILLAAIGGGIGVLSFVAFFGAAILWVRMDQAELPGNEAVALIPRSVLLATGANFLVPSLLVALGFTAVLFVIESWTVEASARTLTKLEGELDKHREIAESRHEEASRASRKAEETTKRAVAAQKAATELASTEMVEPELSANVSQGAEEAMEKADDLWRSTTQDAQDAERDLVEIRRQVEGERLQVRDLIESRRRNLRRSLVFLLFVLGAIAAFLIFSIGLSPGRLFVLTTLLVSLITVCLTVLERTSFAWFALATFIAVGILSGFLTYYRTVDDPKVEPTAVLRTNGAPVFGFFVAQTSDRIYVGTRIAGGAVRLDAIPREEVTDLAVADLEPVAVAEGRALELALEICRLARQRPAAPQAVIATAGASGAAAEKAPEACTSADYRRLRENSEA
jgi:hypothetical protein